MSSTTPNVGLIIWSGSDQYSTSDLAANWNTLDAALADVLQKGVADTLSSTTTVTGTLQFGATNTIPMSQVTITDTSNYKGVRIAGTVFLTKPNATDTVLGIKLDSDSVAETAFRLKIKADGKIYLGNGTAPDVVVYRGTNELLAQVGTDVGTSNPSVVLASVEKGRDYTGPGLAKTNFVWNSDFEFDNAGWLATALSSVTAAATSITSTAITGTSPPAGSKMGLITTPGSVANEGANFPIYRKFQAGIQYNIKARVYSSVSTTNVQTGMGTSGVVYASSTPQALSTTWSEVTFTWTPISTVDSANFFVRLPSTVATTFAVDDVRVYVGSAPVFSSLNHPITETFPRWGVSIGNIVITSASRYIYAVNVEKGMVANRIHVLAGTTLAAGITAAEGALYSVALDTTLSPGNKFNVTRLVQSLNLEAFYYQGPYAPITWEFATPYRFLYTGVAYIGIVITASTMPTLSGRTTIANSGIYSIRGYHWYPLVGLLSSTGTPLPASSTVGELATPGSAANDNLPYAWVS